jgi:hypothetical protein
MTTADNLADKRKNQQKQRAWRTGWDSNPRYGCPYDGFQDRCLKPLGHPSERKIQQARRLVVFLLYSAFARKSYRLENITVSRRHQLVFKTGSLNHSDTLPSRRFYSLQPRPKQEACFDCRQIRFGRLYSRFLGTVNRPSDVFAYVRAQERTK